MQKKQVDKKKYMRKLYPWLLGMILGIMPCIVSASENDSIKVESLLQKAADLGAFRRMEHEDWSHHQRRTTH